MGTGKPCLKIKQRGKKKCKIFIVKLIRKKKKKKKFSPLFHPPSASSRPTINSFTYRCRCKRLSVAQMLVTIRF